MMWWLTCSVWVLACGICHIIYRHTQLRYENGHTRRILSIGVADSYFIPIRNFFCAADKFADMAEV